MEYVYTIMMSAMGGGLLLWAAFSFISGDTLLPRSYSVNKARDKNKYDRQFAKLIALIAIAFFISALVGLTEIYWLALVVFIIGIMVAIKLGKVIMKDAAE